MLTKEKNSLYKAFGISIISEISLPELSQYDMRNEPVDLEIKIGNLSKKWFEVSGKPYDFVINRNLVIFQIPNVAIFQIEDGALITVSPLKDADEDLIRLFILGTCMGAVLMQRKIMPLHGSAIVINGKAYAIVGESGAGKSTLAAGFLNNGYKLLSDDVIAISYSESEKTHIVTPSYPQQKLWEESLKSFGMEVEDYQSIYGRETKYCIPVSSKFFNAPMPLAGIIELVKAENSKIEISKIEKLERFQTLYNHTYRNFFIQKSGLMEWHFQISASMLEKTDMYKLKRPIEGANASQLVSKILNLINKGE
jgi:hypothetical protein